LVQKSQQELGEKMMLFSKVTNGTVRCTACKTALFHSREVCSCGIENLLRHIAVDELEKISKDDYDNSVIAILEDKDIPYEKTLAELKEKLEEKQRKQERREEEKKRRLEPKKRSFEINESKFEAEKIKNSIDEPKKEMTVKQFGVAKAVFGFFIAVGWILVVFGVAIFFIIYVKIGFDKIAALLCASTSVIGVFTVAGGQIGMTQIATAENTAAILAVLTQNSKQNVSISSSD
jgi:hypothetical protein